VEVISGPEPAARLATRTRPTDAAMSNPRETFARVVVGSNAWRAVAVMAPRGSVTSSAQSPNDTVLARSIVEAYLVDIRTGIRLMPFTMSSRLSFGRIPTDRHV
jgi:hypothetical protein